MKLSIGLIVFLIFSALLIVGGVRTIRNGIDGTNPRHISALSAYAVGGLYFLAAAALIAAGYYIFVF
jgi:hypothetical protein